MPLAALALAGTAFCQTVGGEWQRSGPLIQSANDVPLAMCALDDLDGDGVAEVALMRNLAWPLGPCAAIDVHSGRDFRRLHRVRLSRDWTWAWPRASLERIADLDGDGVRDLAAVVVHAGRAPLGAVAVWSAASGTLLRLTPHGGTDEQLCGALADLGDVDGDGFSDYAAGSRDPWRTVFVYSGATGGVLHQVVGPSGSADFGVSVAGPGDLDGDGVPDFTVGASLEVAWTVNGLLHGKVRAYSGASAALLWTALPLAWTGSGGSGFGSRFGFAQDSPGDLDGDGVDDLVVGAWGDGQGTYRGAVYGVSGSDGAPLWRVFGFGGASALGWSVAAVGDADGDGDPDVAAGGPWFTPSGQTSAQYGEVQILDGRTGELLHRAVGGPMSDFGMVVAGLGDLDGDGCAEVGAVATGFVLNPAQAGAYRIRLDPFLHVEPGPMSLASATIVPMRLDFPASEAGMRFVLLGSVTDPARRGAITSTPLAGIQVPLAESLLLQRMTWGWAPSGMLDGQGNARLDVRIPPYPQLLAGRTLQFAAVSLDPATGLGRLASAPRPVVFVP